MGLLIFAKTLTYVFETIAGIIVNVFTIEYTLKRFQDNL